MSLLARRLCHGAIVSSAVGADADIGGEEEKEMQVLYFCLYDLPQFYS